MSYQAGSTLYRLSAGYFIYLPKGVLRLPRHWNLTGPIPWPHRSGRADGLYDEVGMPVTERRLPGLDGPPVDEQIRRWNDVSPRQVYGLSGHNS